MPVESGDDLPVVRTISLSDLADVLARGFDDFIAMKTYVVFVALMYPIIGLALASFVFGTGLIELIYPLAFGFAIIGPFAAVGLYELSRRREMNRDTSWQHAFDVFKSPSSGNILGLGLLLVAVLASWLLIAYGLHIAMFGYSEPLGVSAFLERIFTTRAGYGLIVLGNITGALFALLVLAITVVSFPLLLDRHVSVGTAMATSISAVATNPVPMIAWGAIVLASLLIGMIPLFLGLIIVFPVLGHATWHLYRKVVVPDTSKRPEFKPTDKPKRYAAQFPASLFARSPRRDDGDSV
ncbi:MAG: DUF2189 domain-containing protein [Alphaproteobacteria bacterium]|nr:DUF2189 domain-containing protein [Alphaproteobacteria bacterium]